MQMRKYSPLPCLGAALLTAVLLSSPGCGGGGDTTAPVITKLADSIVTNPTPITYTGGTVTVTAKVSDPSGVNQATVKVNIVDGAGNSLTGGPQIMSPVTGQTDVYTNGPVAVPNNILGTTPVVYTVQVTAADTIGNTARAPVVLGTFTVPNPPAPPGGP
jgi:hypothetical protein